MITWWFKSFRKECPNGRLSRGHLLELFRKVFPAGNGETFCTHIFRIFDSDGNNFLDFKVEYVFDVRSLYFFVMRVFFLAF
jgi:neurocalcin delta